MKQLFIGKTDWSVGLWWQTLEDQKKPVKEARQLAKSLAESSSDSNFNLMAVRKGLILQAGFGVDEYLLHDGGFPLAAALAEIKPSRWLGRFTFNDGVWVIAITDGVILPDGDFFGFEDEADQRIDTLEQFGDWADTVKTSSQEESFEVLAELLKGFKPSVVLEKVIPSKTKYVVTGLAVCAVIAVLGFTISSVLKSPPPIAPPENIPNLSELLGTKKEPPKPKTTSLEYIEPKTTLSACGKLFSELELLTSGWSLKQWRCSGDGTSEQQLERLSFAKFSALPGTASLSPQTPNLATVIVPAAEASYATKTIHLTTELLRFPEIYEAFVNVELAVDGEFTYQASEEPVASADAASSSRLLADGPFTSYSWTITAKAVNFATLGKLQAISGAFVQEINWNPSTQQWTIRGEVYATL